MDLNSENIMNRIIIVDDNSEDIGSIKKVLAGRNIEIHDITKGKGALKKLKETMPDLILLKIPWLGSNAREACKELELDSFFKDTPVIICANDEDFDKKQFFKTGAADYILKPFESEEVKIKIETQLRLRNYQKSLNDIYEKKKAEDQLKIAKMIAESATKTKNNFLTMMSHEIRTPINTIIGITNLLGRTNLQEKQVEYLNKIKLSSKTLLGIINNILDLTKIETEKLAFESIEFNLNDVLDNIANFVEFKVQEKGLELTLWAEQDVPAYLKGDPLRLGQVLLNLANNAVKFTEQGEILITTKLEKMESQSVVLCFSVKDTGIGMSQEQRSRLFQIFGQDDGANSRKFGNSGMGLSISKGLVEGMGGKIWVESEPGKGSQFFFTARFGWVEQKLNKNRFSFEQFQGIRVLVVDDNYFARQALKKYLEDFSFEVTTAESGKAALLELEKIEQQDLEPYQLVFLDWQMPEISGIETARLIRETKVISNSQLIILVTAYNSELLFQEAKKAGINGFLVKPFTQFSLLSTISKVIDYEITEIYRAGRRGIKQEIGLDTIRGARILLVDDDEINREVATEILEHEGFKVSVAVNGMDALTQITGSKGDQFDLVLMDLQMPRMNGYDAVIEIRRDNRFKDLPILAMSADAMSGVREKIFAAGMNDYIEKPIDMKQLFATLKRWILPAKNKTSNSD